MELAACLPRSGFVQQARPADNYCKVRFYEFSRKSVVVAADSNVRYGEMMDKRIQIWNVLHDGEILTMFVSISYFRRRMRLFIRARRFSFGKFNWFSLRGKIKINCQWLLFCTLHNLKKIHQYGLIQVT